jgi:hypothetical protein
VATGYVLALVPILSLAFVAMLVAAPRVLATAWDAVGVRYQAVAGDVRAGETLRALAGVLQICALALPALGIIYSSGRFGRRAQRVIWTRAGETTLSRATLAAVAAGCIFMLWPGGQYRAIGLADQGTLPHAIRAVESRGHRGRGPVRAGEWSPARGLSGGHAPSPRGGPRSASHPPGATVTATRPGTSAAHPVRTGEPRPTGQRAPTPTGTPGSESGSSPTATSTPRPGSSSTPASTPTSTSSQPPATSATPWPSATPTPSASASPAPTATLTPTPPASATPTATPSATPTQPSIATTTPTP